MNQAVKDAILTDEELSALCALPLAPEPFNLVLSARLADPFQDAYVTVSCWIAGKLVISLYSGERLPALSWKFELGPLLTELRLLSGPETHRGVVTELARRCVRECEPEMASAARGHLASPARTPRRGEPALPLLDAAWQLPLDARRIAGALVDGWEASPQELIQAALGAAAAQQV